MEIFDAGSTAENYRRFLQPVIFQPWSERLLSFVGLELGQKVLDVASGTGVVARAAASRVGPTGRVIASDISARMLHSVLVDADPSGASIEVLECSATDIPLDEGGMDVVLCQQGFPFIPDRAAAAQEMHRVLKPGGKVGVAVWAAGKQLEPFDAYAEAVRAEGIESAFGNIATNASVTMSEAEVEQALLSGGFTRVEVTTERLDIRFATIADEVRGIFGTPLGASVAAFEAERLDAFLKDLERRLAGPDGEPVPHSTFAVLGRGVA
jgi:ubiquinone/menaquinone biosynthesis C-methylase UbiE